MHYYGEWPDKKFDQVDDAAAFIGLGLRKWGRIGVMQYKEKYGTVRVYCHLGWWSFYTIWRPSHCWVPKWWPCKFDLTISNWVMPLINRLVVPYQAWQYRRYYRMAIKKWPDLKEEILCDADWYELLKGL